MPRTKSENVRGGASTRGRKPRTQQATRSEQQELPAQQAQQAQPAQSEQQDQQPAQVAVQPVREAQVDQRNEEREERQVRPSRTIWVQSQSKEVDTRVFTELTASGLTNRQEYNNGYFLTWDTLENASSGYTTLREAGYTPRYKFYKLYFTMAGTNGSEDYATLKGNLTSHLESTCPVKVQFCKFYRKDGKLAGGGDLSVDTLDGYNDLLSSKSVHKNYKFGDYSGTFYKFNSKNEKGKRVQTTRNQ